MPLLSAEAEAVEKVREDLRGGRYEIRVVRPVRIDLRGRELEAKGQITWRSADTFACPENSPPEAGER